MDILNEHDARQFVTAWSGHGPSRRRWQFGMAAESQEACATLARLNGHDLLAARHGRAARVLRRAEAAAA